MISAQLRKTARPVRVVNPERRPIRRSNKSGATRRNPAATVLLGYLNPEKKMQQKTQKKIRRKVSNPIRAKAPKPQHVRKAYKPKRKTHRNPSTFAAGGKLLSKPLEMLKAGAVAALAFFATKQLPQAVLKARNTGWVGYLANAVTAMACTIGANKVFGPAAGMSAFAGGSMYVFSRMLNDNTDLGARLNLTGCGDPHAVAGMGAIIPAYFSSPVVLARDGTPMIPRAVINAVKAEMPPPMPAPAMAAAAGVSGPARFSRW